VNPLFFLTRLDTIDDPLAAKATELGFTVLRAPLFATEAGGDAATLAKRISTAGDGVAIAWTSRRAAEVLARPALLQCCKQTFQTNSRGLERRITFPAGSHFSCPCGKPKATGSTGAP